MTDVHAELHAEFERAALLDYLAALGAKLYQLERAALVPVADLAELLRWWSSLLPSTREVVLDNDLGIF